MATTKTLEVWVRVNECGDYEVGTTAEESGERFEENIGTDGETGYRMVKLLVTVPLPETIELSGEVQVTEQPSELKVA